MEQEIERQKQEKRQKDKKTKKDRGRTNQGHPICSHEGTRSSFRSMDIKRGTSGLLNGKLKCSLPKQA